MAIKASGSNAALDIALACSAAAGEGERELDNIAAGPESKASSNTLWVARTERRPGER